MLKEADPYDIDYIKFEDIIQPEEKLEEDEFISDWVLPP